MAKSKKGQEEKHKFHIKVLGRTLEHLGVQMYKRRDVAIAELVANCWDAGASTAHITVPADTDYRPSQSEISITDDGSGMDKSEVQEQYLVVGRNRRTEGPNDINGRPVMGRKGIGKLAGFGIASKMRVLTWRDGRSTAFTLDVDDLKRKDGVSEDVPIMGTLSSVSATSSSQGTTITLSNLKHTTPIDIGKLRESLARRFSRRIRGEMKIYVNGEALHEPDLDFELRNPQDALKEVNLDGGSHIKFYYGFSKAVIKSAELRGFTVYVRGKTAQAPPFFFNVEGTASGQHGTRYITGEIEADFLDMDPNDAADLISTDRQEIDWEASQVLSLRTWGEEMSRKILREWADRKANKMKDWILEEDELRIRIDCLDDVSQKQVSGFLRTLSKVQDEPDRARELADALVQAYEFRHFHNVVGDIENVGDDPEKLSDLLDHLREWQVLESRAILEIVKGRLTVISKFEGMLVNDVPERAPTKGADNVHDMIARYPWLLNPEWQVLSEEKSISTQLREWGEKDIAKEGGSGRYDFLALSDERRLIVIDIKRSGHVVTLDELHRLEDYKERLSRAHNKELYMLMVCGENLAVSDALKKNWKRRPDGEILYWNRVFERAKRHYEHYSAILERNISHPDFVRKEQELAQTREVLKTGTSYRGSATNGPRLGPQDVKYDEDETSVPTRGKTE